MGQVGTLLTLKQQVADDTAFDAAEGWRGDRLMVWDGNGNNPGPLWWETRWATPNDALEFHDAFQTYALALWPGEPQTENGKTSWTSGGTRLEIEVSDRAVTFSRRPGA
jgi:hypothetical protein